MSEHVAGRQRIKDHVCIQSHGWMSGDVANELDMCNRRPGLLGFRFLTILHSSFFF